MRKSKHIPLEGARTLDLEPCRIGGETPRIDPHPAKRGYRIREGTSLMGPGLSQAPSAFCMKTLKGSSV
jgi:hypothetical protein